MLVAGVRTTLGSWPTARDGWVLVFEDDFDGPELDPAVWLPHYLPAWSSRARRPRRRTRSATRACT